MADGDACSMNDSRGAKWKLLSDMQMRSQKVIASLHFGIHF